MSPAVRHIGPIPKAKLGEWSLVLRSQQINHGLSAGPDGYFVTVVEPDVARSVAALRAYEDENKDFRPAPRVVERLPFERSFVAPFVAIAMSIFFLVTGPVALRSAWFGAGTADAYRIFHGEPWRAVTALTLHADTAHVLGNAISGGVFLNLLSRRLGPGRALFLTVVAGGLANVANAGVHLLMHQPHRSIGASTAVFAAVGLLAATQMTINHGAGVRRWTDRVGPIVGGIALLGMLGSSAQSDLWAHLLGLAVGAVLGIIVLLPKRARTPLGPGAQWTLGALSVGLIVASWAVAAVRFPAW
jgi:membrane associated rhomboid family serine protease